MSQFTSRPLSSDVVATLTRLRRQIRSYVFWEGVALVIAFAGVLFWGSFLIDALYFNISRLELPRWLRALFLIASIGSLAGGLVSLLAFRTLRVMRGRALALLLERRFPQLGDGLITAVEAADGDWQPHSPLEQAMLKRTVAEASRMVQRLDMSSVFDPRPLRRAAVAAVVLVVSILGLAVVDSAAMGRWVEGYWYLHSGYWPRKTELVVKVVVQPGDRVREFDGKRYRHPRGGDLQLIVETVDGKEVPDRVQLDYRLRRGSWRRTYLTSTGDQPFQQGFPALLDDLEFWVSGGDFAAAAPWHVQVVDPPRLDALEVHAVYPAYTGLNETDESGQTVRTTLPMLGSQMTLPIGTDVLFVASANKPLAQARVEIDAGPERYEWTIRRTASANTINTAGAAVASGNGGEPATADVAPTGASPSAVLTARARDDLPQSRAGWEPGVAAEFFSDDGLTLRLPFVLRHQGEIALRDLIASVQSEGGHLPAVVPWPADSLLRIHLEDEDGIASPEPIRLNLNSQIDQPPVIDVELKGISSSITRQARIPVAGWIRDEYGVRTVRFDYSIDNETEWKSQELVSPPTEIVREFELARSPTQRYERFDVLPLDLSIKQRLSLTIYAADGDTLYGPNEQRSQKFVFTVVPVEELLSLLYARELNLRKRFEQTLSELKDLQKDLILHRGRAESMESETGDVRQQTQSALLACGERSLHAIRKAATEVQAVEASFQEIREELVNNAAETPQNMERLENKIIAPMTRANAEAFPAVDVAIGLFSLANQQGRNPASAIAQSEEELSRLITTLERVLLEMRKLETFHEALELLKSIIGAQDEISEKTKAERKARALRALD